MNTVLFILQHSTKRIGRGGNCSEFGNYMVCFKKKEGSD